MQHLNRAGRAFGALVVFSHWLASLWILGLMAIVVSDVAMRFLFNAPITGVNEIMEISIVAMLYMQMTQALRDDRHTRSDALHSMVMARNPRAGRLMSAVFYTAGLGLMVAILLGAVPRALEAYNRGYTIGTHGVFIVPEWPVRSIIVYGCTLMGVQFLVLLVAALRAHRAIAEPGPTGA